jgi:hypothetical protein
VIIMCELTACPKIRKLIKGLIKTDGDVTGGAYGLDIIYAGVW